VQHGHHQVEGGAFLRADEVKGHKINTAQNSAQRRHGHEESTLEFSNSKEAGKRTRLLFVPEAQANGEDDNYGNGQEVEVSETRRSREVFDLYAPGVRLKNSKGTGGVGSEAARHSRVRQQILHHQICSGYVRWKLSCKDKKGSMAEDVSNRCFKLDKCSRKKRVVLGHQDTWKKKNLRARSSEHENNNAVALVLTESYLQVAECTAGNRHLHGEFRVAKSRQQRRDSGH
jgi:hypothetical protein